MQSGLTEEVQKSTHSIEQVEAELLSQLQRLNIPPKTLLLAGNSIHADRFFLTLQMPKLIDFLHYRQVDVSTLKSLASAWLPAAKQAPPKQLGHRALDDIRESILELQHYRKIWLITPSAV